MSLLAPGKGKTKRAYAWVYRTTNFVARGVPPSRKTNSCHLTLEWRYVDAT